MYFANNIGDAILTLSTMRALGEMFTAPLTLICPKFAFDLCFREVSRCHVDIRGLPPQGLRPLGPAPHRPLDYETLAWEIGHGLGKVVK
ncbi:MAG: hypothetical protein WCB92_24310 [Mycobacterium sp.]